MKTFMMALLLLLQSRPPQIGNGILSGTVRDVTGIPQSGVRVAAMAAQGSGIPAGVTTTDEAGRYALEIPVGSYYMVMGRAERAVYYPGVDDFAKATTFSINDGSTLTNLDFVAATLTGVVRDTSGKAAAGVRVAAIDASATTARVCRELSFYVAETDSAGRYQLLVAPGRYHVVARGQDHTTFYPSTPDRAKADSVSTAAPSGKSIDLVIPPESPANNLPRDRALYFQASEYLRLGCGFDSARAVLQVLLQTYPDSEYAPKALYATAESFYLEGGPTGRANAEAEFANYLKFFPTAPRADAEKRLEELRRDATAPAAR